MTDGPLGAGLPLQTLTTPKGRPRPPVIFVALGGYYAPRLVGGMGSIVVPWPVRAGEMP